VPTLPIVPPALPAPALTVILGLSFLETVCSSYYYNFFVILVAFGFYGLEREFLIRCYGPGVCTFGVSFNIISFFPFIVIGAT